MTLTDEHIETIRLEWDGVRGVVPLQKFAMKYIPTLLSALEAERAAHAETRRALDGVIEACNHAEAQALGLAVDLKTTEAALAEAMKALGVMLKEHDILSGNFGDVMDPKHKRPDRWPTAAEAARKFLKENGNGC